MKKKRNFIKITDRLKCAGFTKEEYTLYNKYLKMKDTEKLKTLCKCTEDKFCPVCEIIEKAKNFKEKALSYMERKRKNNNN